MIDRIGKYTTTTNIPLPAVTPTVSNVEPQKRKSLLDKFETGVRNSADMTDTIVVSRTIFKGYLGIMLGTAFATLGVFILKPHALSTALKISGLGLSTYGTWAFVRPFVIKDAKGVEHSKKRQ